jgi:hypothetical protein
MRMTLAFVTLFACACEPKSNELPDGGEDLAVQDPWGSCRGKLDTAGATCTPVGELTTCGTWEHDHCCGCAQVDGRAGWLCDQPSRRCEPVRRDDGGVAWPPPALENQGCTGLPIYGERCAPGQLGERFTCSAYTHTLCCTCLSEGNETRWRCESEACAPPDGGP